MPLEISTEITLLKINLGYYLLGNALYNIRGLKGTMNRLFNYTSFQSETAVVM